MVELSKGYRIFVGMKMDGALKRQLHSLEGADRRYVSDESSTFLSICSLGGAEYVGKLVDEQLTTDRVNDVRRNVISILRRLLPETRLPEDLEILVCPPLAEITSESPFKIE